MIFNTDVRWANWERERLQRKQSQWGEDRMRNIAGDVCDSQAWDAMRVKLYQVNQ